jgi:iron complex outermembrane recepter protein
VKPAPLHDPITRLESLVVTGTLDPKTAFDTAQGVAVLDEYELNRRRAQTLGETLSGLTGVSSTYFGPGASRPIIRGLGGDRIRVLSDGIGTFDLSTLSPDHAVGVESSLARRVEILRGPACLLYGNSAVGGVVNVIDGRIPLDDLPTGGLAEARYDSVSDGWTGLFDADASRGKVGFKAQGYRNKSGDIDTPLGRLSGSSSEARSGSVGSALRTRLASFGAALTTRDSYYAIPGGDESIAIDMIQNRLDLEGQLTPAAGFFEMVRVRAGYGRYRHHERDHESGEIHTTFRQNGGEGRLEAGQRRLGLWKGMSGVQLNDTFIESQGEETVVPPARTSDLAFFTLQEVILEKATLQAGLRLEHRRIRLGDVPDDLPPFDGYAPVSGETRRGTSPSISFGAVVFPSEATSLAVSLSANERLPASQELFANGPHGGTGIYEVGNTSLARERSTGLELTIRRKQGWVTGSFGLFAHRFSNYISERRLPSELTPEENNEEGLPAYQFRGSGALFTGTEADLAFHLLDREHQKLHLELGADFVRATDTTGDTPLPRIPPVKAHVDLRYEAPTWYADLGVKWVARQSRVAEEEETETAGYVMVSAETGLRYAFGRQRVDLFVRAQNLGDRLARVHTSYLKDSVPLPGRGVIVGARFSF